MVRHLLMTLMEYFIMNYSFLLMNKWYLIYLDIVLRAFNCVMETVMVMFFTSCLKDLQRKVFLMS